MCSSCRTQAAQERVADCVRPIGRHLARLQRLSLNIASGLSELYMMILDTRRIRRQRCSISQVGAPLLGTLRCTRLLPPRSMPPDQCVPPPFVQA